MKNKKICLNRSFGIQPGAENYDTYVKFVHDVLNTTYLNLASLAKYKGIKDFENANFLEIAREMESLIPLVGPKYLRVMTEVIENVRCNFFLYEQFPTHHHHSTVYVKVHHFIHAIKVHMPNREYDYFLMHD